MFSSDVFLDVAVVVAKTPWLLSFEFENEIEKED